ncbi:MAG TPA: hypothetical protein PKK69_00300 [Ferruginibacter sp.]|nr:hypothetical protein [Ferruginibacter sp.]
MVKQNDWFDPSLMKRIRVRISWLIGLIAALMVYINLDNLKQLYHLIF